MPIQELIDHMARLRDPDRGCPWDLEQTFATLAPYTLEEAYEVVDCLERGDLTGLREELGDLLLQVVFQAQLAREQGAFGFEEVVREICDKYDLPYTTGSLGHQYMQTFWTILKLSLPNKLLEAGADDAPETHSELKFRIRAGVRDSFGVDPDTFSNKRRTDRRALFPCTRSVERELADVGVAGAEHVRAPSQVLHVPAVDLFGLGCDGLVLVGLQCRRPDVEGLGIVRLK